MEAETGSGNRRSSRRGGNGGGSVLGVSFTEGQVLGATSCPASLTSFIKVGITNDAEQVKRLQAFLNKEMSLKLEVNGMYDAATVAAVNAFQLKYSDKILKPWGISEPTGYAYKLTVWWANAIICGAQDTAVMPQI